MATTELDKLAKEEQEADIAFFMIYDPVPPGKEKSMQDIKKFRECHTGGFSSDKLMKEVLLKIPVSTAIEDWLNTIKKVETRRRYKNAIEYIFKSPKTRSAETNPLNKILEDNCAITTLDKHWAGTTGVFNLIKELNAPQSTAKIFLSVYSRFCDFVRTETLGVVDAEEPPKQKIDYYKTLHIYDKIDWEEFISALSEPFNLVAETTYLAANAWEYRLRIVDTRRNALSLETSQINFKNKTISFKAEQSYHVTDLSIPFPKNFLAKLRKYLGTRSGLVFIHQEGKGIFPKQVERAFKKASKSFPYEITPIMLGWAGVITSKKEREKTSERLSSS